MIRPSSAAPDPESLLRAAARRGNGDPIPRPLALALDSRGCSERGRLDALLREIELLAPLFDRDRDVIALDWRLDLDVDDAAAQVSMLFSSLSRHFHLASPEHLRFVLYAASAGAPATLALFDGLGAQRLELEVDAQAAISAPPARLRGLQVVLRRPGETNGERASALAANNCDCLPLGPGSRGWVDGVALRNRPHWSDYRAALDRGQLPLDAAVAD